MSELLSRWAGLALCGIGLVATLALAAAGDLTLYIHPRYVVFTVLLSIVGAGLFAAAVWVTATGREGAHDHDRPATGRESDDDHDHDHDRPAPPRSYRTLSSVVTGALVIASAGALLVAPPMTLSAERALSSASAVDGGGDVPRPSLVGSDPTRFSVRDWASILGSGATAGDLIGQQADVTGFLLIDDAGAVRVGRYAVTCCTVDAQLFAVPVVASDLREDLRSGDWVRVTGTFTDDAGATRLSPATVDAVEEPDAPYLS
ncbi:TIGR03943 family putative permease subunit [Microbacterium proteolyticum]|uniref:TIGR03943 family putative permease subunit n=1 Tax=Microbacterium proteolyticum TaxID=1572644 RepID=UPI001FAD6D5A|nr:TIGR03943 family protein [Microbacterium proteolyticum]MCI9858851.1 TIGR03943 family protein [Microbacterium proteolyticum]